MTIKKETPSAVTPKENPKKHFYVDIYDTAELAFCQVDGLEFEVKTRFSPKKILSVYLSESYNRIGYEKKALSVLECGTYLEFKREASSASDFRLSSANFCRDRLCPMCSWRRSYKIFGQVSDIMNVIGDDYVFIFLTLTVPNCKPDELPDLLDEMQKGWLLLKQMKRFKGAVKGFFKALEVTRNREKNTYHPHYHCILAVDKQYFRGRRYIKHDEWLEMWRQVMKDPSITQVDVRRCQQKEIDESGEVAVKTIASAVAEVAKYSVKSSDYLYEDSLEETDEAVKTLANSLYRRRLCSFGGCFDAVRKELNLDDCENGDLIHLDDVSLREDVAVQIYRYGWVCGAYKLTFVGNEISIDVEYEE